MLSEINFSKKSDQGTINSPCEELRDGEVDHPYVKQEGLITKKQYE